MKYKGFFSEKIFVKIFVILFIFSLNLKSKIIETNDLKDILKYATDDTVVVFDIDHTVGENIVDLDSWIPFNVKTLENGGLSTSDAWMYTLSLYYVLQNSVGFSTVGGSENVIRKLQEKKVKVMSLTNRSLPIMNATISELNKVGIDFSKTSLTTDFLELNIHHVGQFNKGIIFCGSNDKGKMLFNYFDEIEYKPSKIIFIDDKIKYVKSVHDAAEDRNVDIVSIRYSFQDEKKENIDFNKLNEKVEKLKTFVGLNPL